MDETTSRRVRLFRYTSQVLLVAGGLLFVAGVVAGSNAASSLNNPATRESLSVPRWLYLLTGGAVIGASGMLSMTVTDRQFIRSIHDWNRVVPTRSSVQRGLTRIVQAVTGGFVVLVIYQGFVGPQIPTVNVAIILVFAGIRAGLTMVTYTIGNPWPVVNPWRALAELFSRSNEGYLSYPDRWGVWPATIGLLAFVFIETVTPVNRRPAFLAAAIVIYSVLTIGGAVLVGIETWFEKVDPIAVTFRFFGQVAPIQRTDDGLELTLPGTTLEGTSVIETVSDTAFVIALIWELTYSGFVTTVPGGRFIRTVVDVGIPPLAVYLGLFVGGYAVFFGAYWLAARYSRRLTRTFLSVETVGTRLAPPLVAIAAGYHLAHYFGFFVSVSPSLYGAIVTPLTLPANPLQVVLPSWFGGLNVAFVLVGHLLAVWIAHATAFDLFPGRLQAIRSQYPFIVVMISYTVISLWLISLPTASPPFV